MSELVMMRGNVCSRVHRNFPKIPSVHQEGGKRDAISYFHVVQNNSVHSSHVAYEEVKTHCGDLEVNAPDSSMHNSIKLLLGLWITLI